MSYDLYRKVRGSISRKNAKGVRESHEPPYEFVPTPSELKFLGDQMEKIGTVEDSDPRVADMLANLSDDDSAQSAKPPPVRKGVNIAKLDENSAKASIERTDDLERLDEFFLQESERKPRSRVRVLKAIQDRQEVLGRDLGAESGSVVGDQD